MIFYLYILLPKVYFLMKAFLSSLFSCFNVYICFVFAKKQSVSVKDYESMKIGV